MSLLRRRPKDAPPRREREPGEFASVTLERPAARMVTPALLAARPAAPGQGKVSAKARVSKSLRDSARGEDCLVRLPGCPGDPAMTIWSHNRHQRAGKGGAIKAIDLNGAYCCTYCDAIYDGQQPLPEGVTREEVELAWFMAHAESLVRLAQKGLV